MPYAVEDVEEEAIEVPEPELDIPLGIELRPDDLIIHQLNGSPIHQSIIDGYINLNQMADAAGKRVDNWLGNQSTKDLIAEYEKQRDSNTRNSGYLNPALITLRGNGCGTWAHPLIAIQFAQWCSAAFALQVSRWIYDWQTTGKKPVEEIELSVGDRLVAQAIAYRDHERKLQSLEIEQTRLRLEEESLRFLLRWNLTTTQF